MWYILGPWKKKAIGKELPLSVRRRAYETFPSSSIDSRTIYHLKSRRGVVYVVQWESEPPPFQNTKLNHIVIRESQVGQNVLTKTFLVRLSLYFSGGEEDNYHVEFPKGSDKITIIKSLKKLISLIEEG